MPEIVSPGGDRLISPQLLDSWVIFAVQLPQFAAGDRITPRIYPAFAAVKARLAGSLSWPWGHQQ